MAVVAADEADVRWWWRRIALLLLLLLLCDRRPLDGRTAVPLGISFKFSNRLSTATPFRWMTWKPGAIPPQCFSLCAQKKEECINNAVHQSINVVSQEETQQKLLRWYRLRLFLAYWFVSISSFFFLPRFILYNNSVKRYQPNWNINCSVETVEREE